jgi:TRAP-type uncharacterized transport system substrate-binding protein
MKLDRLDLTWVKLFVFVVLAVAILVFIYYRVVALLPPDRIRFAAGSGGSAYHQLAQQYRSILARDGIEVEILETAGSVENAALVAGPDADADVALLQGGVPIPEDRPVEALAATFLEPLWIMHDGALGDPADPAHWDGLEIAAGAEGSGTRFVIDALTRVVGETMATNDFLPLGGQAAADALLAGDADAAIFVAPVTAPYLQPLFQDSGMTTASIRDGEALTRQLPFVRQVRIPRSGFDYAAEDPPETVELIAMVCRLAAPAVLHPALVDRLIHAARIVHSGRDLITDENEFPSTENVAMPMNAQAEDLIRKPPSPLYRFLPYWVVAQVNSFALLLVPLLVVILPLMRILPGLYEWQMRARIYRRYPELRDIEREVAEAEDPAQIADLERRLGQVEEHVSRLVLPMRYHEYAYTLRVHIDLIRRKLERKRAAGTAG